MIFTNAEVLERQQRIDRELGSSSHKWEGFVFEPGMDIELLVEEVKKLRDQQDEHSFNMKFFPDLSEQGIKEHYGDPSRPPSEFKARCLSPWVAGYVFADGSLGPCLDSTYSFGNVRTEGVKKAWNSKNALTFRRLLKKEKMFPTCVACTELYRH